jgi:myo-inositol-1(or 4)-monophosphatase
LREQDLADRFAAAKSIAREVGAMALVRFRNRDGLAVERKGVQDQVTAVDREVEAAIRARLGALFPNDGVLGEEAGGAITPRLWVVDPIDGTACFIAGIPVWCVSIAFVDGGEVELGVIYDPNNDELFAACRGHGASLDGAPLRPSPATGFADGSVGVGYSPRTSPGALVDVLEPLLQADGMFQCNGSGALMLTYVAAGRLIGYFEAHINAWDCLAGIALVREAGGWTSDFLAGDGLAKGNPLAAAAPGLADAMRRLTGLN